MVEQIASFLSDNALTRSWAETMDRHVITPIELQFVKEMPEDGRFRAFASRLVEDNGALNQRGTAFVDAVREGKGDTPEVKQSVADLFASDLGQEHSQAVNIRLLHELALKAEGEGLKKGLDVLAPRDGRNGYTELGRQMRQYGLGSPVAAYGLPAAGVGLAAWGIHDVMAAQQQAEKESQLPLQGGVR